MRMLQMLVLPLLVSSLITGTGRCGATRHMSLRQTHDAGDGDGSSLIWSGSNRTADIVTRGAEAIPFFSVRLRI